MTNFRNLFAISATAACVAIGHHVNAQDDLDDLLNDLADDTPVETKAKPAEDSAPAAEATPAAEPAEAPAADDADEAPADEAETPAADEADENVAEVTPSTAEPAEKDEGETAGAGVNLLNDLAEEAEEEPAEPVAVAAEPKPAAAKPAEAAPAVVETKPAVDPDVYTGKDKELIEALKATSIIQMRSLEIQAKREMDEALRCGEEEEYKEMARHYANALKLLGDSEKNASQRKVCEMGIAEGLYRAAIQEYTTGRRENAMKLIEKAIERRHPKARRQHEAWLRAGDPDANKVDYSVISHYRNDEEYKARREKNNQHLKRSEQLLAQGQLKKALEECELVLVTDEYNKEALKLREKIQQRRQTITQTERAATRAGMIAQVDEAWRPVYAVDAREVETGKKETVKKPVGHGDPERAQEQKIIERMKEMRLPAISFKPPATLIDAVEFFRTASKDFDRPDLPFEQRGFNFVLNLPKALSAAGAPAEEEEESGFGDDSDDAAAAAGTPGVPVIPMITASDISFYEALKLVCESVEYKFTVKGPIVMVMHKNASVEEMVTRSYPVLSSFMDRMNVATEDMKTMNNGRGSPFGGGNARSDDGEENQERDWKQFFELLGVKWPEGSSIMYIKTIGKLRVKNTYDNLAELEQALTEMNADPKLIEIETRFVEVCQEDLNSLGFEWILNSDYTMNVGNHLGRALGLRNGKFSDAAVTAGGAGGAAGTAGGTTTVGGLTTTTTGTAAGPSAVGATGPTAGGSWVRGSSTRHNMGLSAFGGTSDYQNGQRYLSTIGNHVSGANLSTNDQFMRVNAFLGAADLSMILHMLSQRSDTDLLSAPKVLTQSGQQAVMKVVTEYIYPTDYDVQLQSSSSSSGGSNGGGSQSAILAVVEPQSFTMREVGVILDVTPTLTDDGNLIDLDLNTQVVDEPTWKNYGMRIPFTGNSSLQSFEGIGDILTGLSDVLTTLGTGIDNTVKAAFAETAVNSASSALENLTKTTSDNMTYYDAPMEQPFFHVRSVVSKLSVYPGATIVMGGLITEQRKAMDDKVPFLGDLPFIGRLFRSHAEYTSKRNLLIFVTTRLVDTRGRELRPSDGDMHDTPDVVAAPAAD